MERTYVPDISASRRSALKQNAIKNISDRHPKTLTLEASMDAQQTARVVLVVEDEACLRVYGRHALEANGGEQALGNHVDVDFTDVRAMKGGHKCLSKIFQHGPSG
jgi:predicted PilT family ATPase